MICLVVSIQWVSCHLVSIVNFGHLFSPCENLPHRSIWVILNNERLVKRCGCISMCCVLRINIECARYALLDGITALNLYWDVISWIRGVHHKCPIALVEFDPLGQLVIRWCPRLSTPTHVVSVAILEIGHLQVTDSSFLPNDRLLVRYCL
jgi:hypothetical protein